ncbi:MAG: amino acid permease [Streptosporangiaceae bacterium]
MAVRKAAGLLSGGQGSEIPETFWYTAKRRMLGPPMVTEQLRTERLSRPLGLGVLSCDGISSAAYGTEEMLIVLLPAVGLAAFQLIVPMTLVILFGIVIVVLSYREVVSVYTRAGGSYVVARENFGPRIAQIAAVALLIDYVVTVAVQVAAAAAVIVSAFPSLGRLPSPFGPNILDVLSVLFILIMCYGNLRGIREAGKTFALPTYLFSGAVGLMIIVGLLREAMGDLHHVPHYAGPTFAFGHSTQGLVSFAMIYMLLKAYANGGSSLTGIEAVSNAVSALRPPEGRNARQLLVTQGSIVIFLIGGISWLSHVTHAVPYTSGYPTVLAQEADVVFGSTGHVLYWVVIAATAAILFTGGNTSFSGFPFLASFVAEDSFLPRWLTKRGHRLVFSNGIIILTIVSLTLGLVVGFNVDGLVPFYAIGVFTGFSMAGFGMARYHLRTREPGWRRRLIINTIGGVYTVLVVFIFAIVKFKEGAWLVVIVGPLLVFVLIRLNREYRAEARVLETIGERRASGVPQSQPNYTRRVVIVFVDDFDLSTIAALRYAKSLRPTTVRAVHFVIDSEQAERLRAAWLPDRSVSLDFVDCPDRRLTRCAAELVSREAEQPGTQVTAILPRRSFSPLLGRFLHDRTADKIAGVVSRVPNAAATIVPFDVQNRIRVLQERQAEREMRAPVALTPVPGPPADAVAAERADFPSEVASTAVGDGQAEPLPGAGGYDRPIPPAGVTPIGSIREPRRTTVEGRVRTVEIRSVEHNSVLACEISDSTGDLTALFYGRSRIPGLMCGARVRFNGAVGIKNGAPVMINPAYELVVPGATGKPGRDGE